MYTLVTGATGFIGKRLIKQLLEENRKIRCLVRKTSNIEHLISTGVEIVYGDIMDEQTVKDALENVSVIYHLAAKANPSNVLPYKHYQANVIGTENILKCSVNNPHIKKIVLMSSIAATGPSITGDLLNEDSKLNPITNYGVSKANVEKIAMEYNQKYKLPIVLIRPPMVYGIGDKDWVGFFNMIKNASEKNKKLPIPGDHKNLFDFCYVDNLVAGLILAEKSSVTVGKVYFISDERPYRIEEILATVSKAYNVKAPSKFFSINTIKTLANVFDFLGKVFRFDGPISSRDFKWMTTNYWVCDCSKAKKEFGYNPDISLEEGIKRTIAWCKSDMKGD